MNKYSRHFLFISVALMMQIFIPSFMFKSINVSADILIIFLTYLGFYYGRYIAIISGFFFGLTQDLLTQLELLGAMAFAKSAIGFGLGSLELYRQIWSKKLRLIVIFKMYFVHFLIADYLPLLD